ncbi:cyclase family protein [Methanococcus maripaludis C5]|uniref:Cyclase family protein n=1 Tax=Methanococcus maripaludis (strain C5 / ATCC BAA-1333) TaxID=402880 RepID=A4G063_METM5|nr:cyclase family protein [Methanococcus maripaludis]ABO35847.1 cyclase family protein [Methanococcus maripaludis C5]
MAEEKIINLSHELKNFVYPNDPESSVETKKNGKYFVSELKMGAHTGTHVDYPMHVGLTNEKFENVFGNGYCVSFENLEDFFKNCPEDLEILLIKTDFSKYWGNDAYFEKEIDIENHVKKIISLNLKAVGVDCYSIGNFSVHEKILSSKIKIIENMKNLEILENRSFKFFGFPLNIEKIDGSPINAVAFL